MTPQRWILASQSPRRQELLRMLLPRFETVDAQIDEAGIAAQTPQALALALGQAKALAVAGRYPAGVTIGCDTVVDLDGRVLGKPQTPQQAAAMLAGLSGRQHLVHTGVHIAAPGQTFGFVETTAVFFDTLPLDAIDAYVQTPHPYDKAGGYGIQGWAGQFIPRIEGCYYNVMGLPLAALRRALSNMHLFP